jgi:hypothetical protein
MTREFPTPDAPLGPCAACERRRLRRRLRALEAEVDRLNLECHRLEAFEPKPGKRLRFARPHEVRVRFPDGKPMVSFGYLPDEVEVTL